ncbi:neural cell adhesion molecule 1 [Biomphalaria pfeifferi]|uniref:Neural cell adhesion molecule 1 n=1 Tax=Biomphalaria pfeifferi TaxID=112525 RepID=A0AAD8AU14_BIOPF|nr:neural cell adhesion molecule 1 [Biomphalaria pfeifferi]
MDKAISIFVMCFLWQEVFVSSQLSSPSASLENGNVKLTFNVPMNLREDITIIKLDPGDGSQSQNVLFFYISDLSTKVGVAYTNRLTVITSERKVEITLPGVQSRDAGMYKCLDGTGLTATVLPNCGHKLIIVRKPKPPSILSLTSALEGQTLKLSCNTSSTSLPPDHGLNSNILWRDEQNTIIGIPAGNKFVMNADGHLEILNIQRLDRGRKFTCTSSDKADNIDNAPVSDPSLPYEIKPEYKPSSSDMVLDPAIVSDSKIVRRENEDLTITCTITCEPACSVQWSFQAYASSSFSPVQLSESHILKLKVKQTDQGTYRCTGTNKHGETYKEFQLEVNYINIPVVSVNEKTEDSSRVVENEQVRLYCTIDAKPAPKITWNSPTGVLQSEEGKPSPQVSSRALQNNYTSSYTLTSIQCENSGMYSCEGHNIVSSVERKINILVMCPPSSSAIPDLALEPEYVWEMSKSFSFSFVIKAFPEPEVVRVISMVNDISRTEEKNKDITITKSSKYDGKDYLTKFTFTVIRTLDMNDKDRIFKMTFESSEFKRDLQFIIRPRGPPQPVTNITTVDITHNSVKIFWFAAFNGGEQQNFNVEYRHFIESSSSPWTTGANDIKDLHLSGMWTEAVIKNLGSSTDYEFRIVSTNSLGTAQSLPFRVRTLEGPAEALSGGAIAGIVIAVLIIIAIVLIVLYVFIYRRRWGKQKETGETRKAMLPAGLTKVFKRAPKSNVKQEPNGMTSAPSDKSKHASIFKTKKLLHPKSKPKELYPNRKNSEEESDNESYDDDRFQQEDGDYINTELRPMEPDRDEYLNAGDLRRQKEYNQKEADKKRNKDALNYVSIDFDNIQKAKDKKKKKKNKELPARETGPYSEIDFEKTQALRQKMLAEESTEQVLAAETPEHFENEPSVDTSAEDNDDRKRQPLELMGTAV